MRVGSYTRRVLYSIVYYQQYIIIIEVFLVLLIFGHLFAFSVGTVFALFPYPLYRQVAELTTGAPALPYVSTGMEV